MPALTCWVPLRSAPASGYQSLPELEGLWRLSSEAVTDTWASQGCNGLTAREQGLERSGLLVKQEGGTPGSCAQFPFHPRSEEIEKLREVLTPKVRGESACPHEKQPRL